MRISDWSSDVCSSDLGVKNRADPDTALRIILKGTGLTYQRDGNIFVVKAVGNASQAAPAASANDYGDEIVVTAQKKVERSEEHTSELQSLMRSSYAVFCLKKKNTSK